MKSRCSFINIACVSFLPAPSPRAAACPACVNVALQQSSTQPGVAGPAPGACWRWPLRLARAKRRTSHASLKNLADFHRCNFLQRAILCGQIPGVLKARRGSTAFRTGSSSLPRGCRGANESERNVGHLCVGEVPAGSQASVALFDLS